MSLGCENLIVKLLSDTEIEVLKIFTDGDPAFLVRRIISVHCVAEVIPTDGILAGFLVSLIRNKKEKGVSNGNTVI